MGSSSSSHYDSLGAHSSAREVLEHFASASGGSSSNYLAGKTALVTGGNSGIGLETCKVLAYAGAKVILCSRSVAAGEQAIESEIKVLGHGGYLVPSPNIVVKALDLNSLASVRTLAEHVNAEESRIDFLVLNAGIMCTPDLQHTEDGFEKQIGVNHFGHFYLTQLLRPKMEAQIFPSRVVVLSSSAHNMGTVELDDLHFAKGRKYSKWPAYGQSKQANLLFAKELASQFVASGKPIKVMAIHPGVIQTNLWRETGVASGIGALVLSSFISDKTVPQGAATTIWACLNTYVDREDVKTSDGENDLSGGKLPINGSYLCDCAPKLASNAAAIDANGTLSKALWKVTEDQLKEVLAKPKSK